MATKTRARHSKAAATYGRYSVWFAEIDDDGDVLFDIRVGREHYMSGMSLEDATDEAARLDREERVTALREQLDGLASALDDDTDEAIAKLTAAVASLKA